MEKRSHRDTKVRKMCFLTCPRMCGQGLSNGKTREKSWTDYYKDFLELYWTGTDDDKDKRELILSFSPLFCPDDIQIARTR